MSPETTAAGPPRLRKPTASAPESVTKPAPLNPTPVRAKLPHPFERFVGKRCVVTTRSPVAVPIVIEGTLTEMREGMLVFTQCRVVGQKHTSLVDELVLVTRENVSHINSVATEVTATA